MSFNTLDNQLIINNKKPTIMKGLLFVLLCTVLSIFSCKNFPIGHGPHPVEKDSLDSTEVVDSINSVAHADSMAKITKK